MASRFGPSSEVAYILSLGVIKPLRRHGIGLLTGHPTLIYNNYPPFTLWHPKIFLKVWHQNSICYIVSASLLLDNLLAFLTTTKHSVKVVYLHVLATNQGAITFYEKRHFRKHHFLPCYYVIKGASQDGFSYARYINGGEPPVSILYPFKLHVFKLLQYMFSALFLIQVYLLYEFIVFLNRQLHWSCVVCVQSAQDSNLQLLSNLTPHRHLPPRPATIQDLPQILSAFT